jgi:hypothetical protein
MSNPNIPPADPSLKADLTTDSEQHDEVHERVLLRKMDALLMPLLTISYGLQFVRRRIVQELNISDNGAFIQYDKFVFSSAAVTECSQTCISLF